MRFYIQTKSSFRGSGLYGPFDSFGETVECLRDAGWEQFKSDSEFLWVFPDDDTTLAQIRKDRAKHPSNLPNIND